MKNNVKVALAVLDLLERELPITINAINVSTKVHKTTVGEFLQYWKAVGWLTSRKEGIRLFYSVTEQGVVGFKKLVPAADQGNAESQ